MENIDVVIPWLNPTEKWFSEYEKYREDEDPCRIRDLHTMQPTLKGILNNLPWVRYIWLIVFDEEQLENLNWPELKNEKIKIVYHKDIIPQEFLPNFNSLLPTIFMHKIEGLSNYILFMNDDMIINKFIPKEMYFENGKSVHHRTIFKGIRQDDNICMWSHIIYNTQQLFNTMMPFPCICDTWHMPVPLLKDTLLFLHKNKGKELYNSCINAKIRRNYSISIVELAYWMEEAYNHIISKPIYNTITRNFLVLKDTTTNDEIKNSKNYHITCINDSEDLKTDIERITKQIDATYEEI